MLLTFSLFVTTTAMGKIVATLFLPPAGTAAIRLKEMRLSAHPESRTKTDDDRCRCPGFDAVKQHPFSGERETHFNVACSDGEQLRWSNFGIK